MQRAQGQMDFQIRCPSVSAAFATYALGKNPEEFLLRNPGT